MADLYVFDFGDAGREERARRDAELVDIRARFVQRVIRLAGLDPAAAELAIAAVFDHRDGEQAACECSCHPRLDTTHDGGFDCRCTWDDARREAQRRKWTEFWDSPASRELAAAHEAEEAAIADWLAGQRDVTAKRTTSMAPEQWEGAIDGRSFYFRERHGMWRIEIDLEPNGRFADRYVGTDDSGKMITEPVPLTEGRVIAEGVDTQLGETPVHHVEFIVRTVREHLWGEMCDHAGALFFCPKCGTRISEPTC